MIIGATMNPNSRPTCWPSMTVPRNSPMTEKAMAPKTVTASATPQCASASPSTGPMIRREMGRTKSAARTPCTAPAMTFSSATRRLSTGASRRSSISRV